MSIEPGKTLLHYEIVEKLGAGGMGEVWLARDTSLDREVAIKVLPDIFSADPERLARFEREAKLLAALEHPNVATVFGLHEVPAESPGQTLHFLAMEYVRGQDLAVRMTRGRAIVEEALGVALQIAEALAAAHDRGIVHRDLKPANILLTPDAKVKVLDFGLAKAFEIDPVSSTNPSMSPTLTSAGTIAGVILGTAGYMSPEQARGHTVDKRADIWAFGCVLFEMLSAQQAFHGPTVSDTLASVLKVEPDWSRLPSDTPRGVLRLIKRCLQKDARQRLHDIADARIEIEEALAALGESGAGVEQPVSASHRRSGRWAVTALALAGLALGVAIGWSLKAPRVDPPVRRHVLTAPDASTEMSDPVISPDGRQIAFVLNGELYIRNMARFQSRAVEGTKDARAPFWSPDGSSVAYHANGKLWKHPVAGGERSAVCDLEGLDHGSWGDEGTIVLTTGRKVLQVSARGGDVRVLFQGESVVDYHGIDHLPAGRGLLILVHGIAGVNTLEVWRGDDHKKILELDDYTATPSFVEPGYIVYARRLSNAGIWALPFSPGQAEPAGDPFLVASNGHSPSADRAGTLIYLGGGSLSEVQLVSIGLDDGSEQQIGQPQADMWVPTLSHDGSRAIVTGREQNEYDLWIHDASRGTKTRLTFTEEIESAGFWSPDGKQVFFFHPVFGQSPKVYTVSSDGSGEPAVVTEGAQPTLSSDGEVMAFVRRGAATGEDLWMMRLDGASQPEAFVATAAEENTPRLSPDGKFLAYVSDESGRDQIYVKHFPSGTGRWQVSVDGGNWPRWNREGDRLYFVNDDRLMQVSVDAGTGLRLSSPELVLDASTHRLRLSRSFAVAPDGDRIVAVQRVADETAGAEEQPPQGIYVVENWLAEFAE